MLSSRQKAAAQIIAAGLPKKTAAKEVGVRPETISLWCHNPEFQAEIDYLQKQAFEIVIYKLRNMLPLAVEGLANLLISENEITRRRSIEMALNYAGFRHTQIDLKLALEGENEDEDPIDKLKRLVGVINETLGTDEEDSKES